jgi:hypothetical protein
MAETVSNHQTSTFTTPVNGTTGDATVVLGNDNTLVANNNAHDADPSIHLQSSALGSRPAAGTQGRKWLTSDGLKLYYDTGSVWSEIAYLPFSSGGAITRVLYQNSNFTITSAGDTSGASFSLPGGTLAVNNQALRITVAGNLDTATANLNVKFGATTLFSRNGNVGAFFATALVTRTGATAQFGNIQYTCGDPLLSSAGTSGTIRVSPAETLSGAVLIDFRGSNGGAGTVRVDTIQVEFITV